MKSSSPEKNEIVNMESNACGINACASPINSALQTLLCKDNTSGIRCCTSTSPIVGKSESPLVDLTNDSCSKNWCLSVGEKSESVKRTRKFKRLRKVADNEEHENLHTRRESFPNPRAKLARSFTRHKLGRGILELYFMHPCSFCNFPFCFVYCRSFLLKTEVQCLLEF